MASLSSTHYLTSDDLNKIFQSTRKSVDYLSEFDDSSTEASTDSSFWESSDTETDSTAIDDLSSEQSGSEPSEPSGEDSHDSDQASESNCTTTQPYNLHLRKRARPSEFLPSAKRSRLDVNSDASTSRSKGQRGQGDRGDRGGRGGWGGQGGHGGRGGEG